MARRPRNQIPRLGPALAPEMPVCPEQLFGAGLVPGDIGPPWGCGRIQAQLSQAPELPQLVLRGPGERLRLLHFPCCSDHPMPLYVQNRRQGVSSERKPADYLTFQSSLTLSSGLNLVAGLPDRGWGAVGSISRSGEAGEEQ